MSAKRVLPADVYDALQVSAEKYGGIGYGVVAELGSETPCCVLGHAEMIDHGFPQAEARSGHAVSALRAALDVAEWFDVGDINDKAIRDINQRKGVFVHDRVSFAEWCAELGVERGS